MQLKYHIGQLYFCQQELNKQTADEIVKQGGTAYAYRCDVSDYDDVVKTAQLVCILVATHLKGK